MFILVVYTSAEVPMFILVVYTSAEVPMFILVVYTSTHVHTGSVYFAIQAGLLTPLTFAWHCLSPLAAFTSSAYFRHNGRR